MLTQKQENFCLAYIETGNAAEAYKRSFNAQNMKPDTIYVKASNLLAMDKIAVRLEELRKPAVQAAQMTLEQHLADLKMLRDAAFAAEKYGPAIQAETVRGKAAGLHVERTELTGKDGKDLIPTITIMRKPKIES